MGRFDYIVPLPHAQVTLDNLAILFKSIAEGGGGGGGHWPFVAP